MYLCQPLLFNLGKAPTQEMGGWGGGMERNWGQVRKRGGYEGLLDALCLWVFTSYVSCLLLKNNLPILTRF